MSDTVADMPESFASLKDDFLRIVSETAWCSLSTVDGKGRPRSRIVHPIWEVTNDRPVGFIFTANAGVKGKHLAANPNVSFAYWHPSQNVILGESTATWVDQDDFDTKQRVWDLFTTTPPPLGYDLTLFGMDSPRNPMFTLLRLEPWRVQVLRGEEFPQNIQPRLWRAE